MRLAYTARPYRACSIAEIVIRDVELELAEFTSASQRRGAEAVFAACIAITRPGDTLDL